MNARWGIIIAALVFLVQFALVPGTGMTWDEPSSFFFGRANLKFLMTGNRQYLTDLRSTTLFADSPFPYIYGEDLYPPFPFVVESAFSYLLAETNNILSVIDAHHAGEVFLGAIGALAFYAVAVEIGLSTIVAVVTTLLFALYPTISGQMRSDAKDVPMMSMLTIFVFAALRFIRSLKHRSFFLHLNWALVAGVSLGLACASKITAPVILVPLGIWFILALLRSTAFRRSVGTAGRLIPLILLIGFAALGTFVFMWPWLWDNPIGHLSEVWQFFRVVGYGMPVQYFGHTYLAGINLPPAYPFVILGVQTPVELIVLALVGMAAAVYLFIKNKNVYGLFILLWFWFGMARFLVPGIIIYARVRHFIDVMPAFFLLIGLGMEVVRSRVRSSVIFVLLISAIVIHVLWIDVTHYPYEPSYFNALVGGTKRVAQTASFDVEYWGSTVAEGMKWVASQPGEKVVYACGLRHVAIFYTDPSIRISPTPDTGNFVFVPNAYSWFGGPKNVYSSVGPPVYTITRAGAPLMYIYKITDKTWWCGYETDMEKPAERL